MNRNYDVANFVDIIDIATMLIKTIYKDPKKSKQLEKAY